MISYDESSVKARLRGEARVFRRTYDKYPSYGRRSSRNAFAKGVQEFIRKTGVTLFEAFLPGSKYKSGIMQLTCLKGINKFNLIRIEVDYKRCNIAYNDTNLIIGEHFIMRLMQTARAEKVKEVAPILNSLVNVISNRVFQQYSQFDECHLYLTDFGFIPILIKNDEYILKSFVPLKSITSGTHFKNMAIADNKENGTYCFGVYI